MFTGIVTAIGTVTRASPRADGVRLDIAAPDLDLADGMLGESIAVAGACLTAIAIGDACFSADVSPETIACTTLGNFAAGDRVNLERALLLSARLGGHIVSGHVDGIGRVVEFERQPGGACMTIEVPGDLARYIARKGSVCIDGVSLTVNTTHANAFTIQVIPHTLQATTIGDYAAGRAVNVEVDLLARHLERLLTERSDEVAVIDEAMLRRTGFID